MPDLQIAYHTSTELCAAMAAEKIWDLSSLFSNLCLISVSLFYKLSSDYTKTFQGKSDSYGLKPEGNIILTCHMSQGITLHPVNPVVGPITSAYV